jgi:hypothetical protein
LDLDSTCNRSSSSSLLRMEVVRKKKSSNGISGTNNNTVIPTFPLPINTVLPQPIREIVITENGSPIIGLDGQPITVNTAQINLR